jgi:hypothetical protein
MTNLVTAFKSLGPNEYTITEFPAYSSFRYTYISGSNSNSNDVQITYGVEYAGSLNVRVENSTYEWYDSVMQTFYSALPYTQYGINSSSYQPSGSVFIVSVTQDVYGEEIKPGTLSISVGASSSYDDGKGNLIISQSGTGSTIGSIFYDKGIALLRPTESIVSGGLTRNGICIVSGTNVAVNFTSSVRLYEHSIKVKINPAEFNFSLYNPTVENTPYTGSTKTPLQQMVTRSMYPQDTTYLAPYITGIGLYNERNELLAVAKVSNPIQRTFDSTQTFIIKFDT